VAPMVPAEEDISTVTLPGRTIKDMLDHFPIRGGTGKDSRSDPQLVWTFEGEDVLIRSYEMGIDTRGRSFHQP
jgi:cell cycle checkpoint control protein RAD9A